MTTALNARAINEGIATPATPACNTNTPIQLPMTLIILDAKETYIVVFVFPIERNKDAPAL